MKRNVAFANIIEFNVKVEILLSLQGRYFKEMSTKNPKKNCSWQYVIYHVKEETSNF